MPIITFVQPLWWKALIIIMSEPPGSDLRKIVLRLGGFHTEMSFLGCIGSLMAGSGLKELLEAVYAPNAVEHILTCKPIAQAVHAHLLVDAALNTQVLPKTLNVSFPGKISQMIRPNLKINHTLLKKLKILISKRHVLCRRI